jgi:hypothetical protein
MCAIQQRIDFLRSAGPILASGYNGGRLGNYLDPTAARSVFVEARVSRGHSPDRIWVVFHSTTLGRYRLTLDETSSVLSFAISLFGCLSKRASAQPQYSRHGDRDGIRFRCRSACTTKPFRC